MLSREKKKMVGIFSKFSVSRSGHRRAQHALEEKEVIPPNVDASDAADVAAPDTSNAGFNLAIEFKPVEHPLEPLNSDEPVHCPPPEPSILNDGRLWKERLSAASIRRRTNSSVTNEGTTDSDESVRTKAYRPPSRRMFSHSQSAPEHNLLDLLEECNTSQH